MYSNEKQWKDIHYTVHKIYLQFQIKLFKVMLNERRDITINL